MKLPFLSVAAVFAATLSIGCKGAENEYEPAFVPKVHAFEGEVEAKFAGQWKSVDGAATLELGKDGGLKIETTTRSQSGESTSRVDGNWRAKDGSLLFRYVVGSQPETVLKYTAELSGDTLALKQDGGKMKTIYKRK